MECFHFWLPPLLHSIQGSIQTLCVHGKYKSKVNKTILCWHFSMISLALALFLKWKSDWCSMKLTSILRLLKKFWFFECVLRFFEINEFIHVTTKAKLYFWKGKTNKGIQRKTEYSCGWGAHMRILHISWNFIIGCTSMNDE